MDLLRTLVALATLACATCHAGYAQLASPPGFTTSSYGWGYAASANDAAFGRVLHQPNGLTANVAGQVVKMPAAYRLAANAPRIAAAVIYANPALRTALGIATWLGVAKVVWNEVERRWEQHGTEEMAPDFVYRVASPSEAGKYLTASTQQAVCNAWAGAAASDGLTWSVTSIGTGYCSMRRSDGGSMDVSVEKQTKPCPGGSTPSPGGCIVGSPPRPLNEEQMVEVLNPANQPGWPMPSTVPFELPRPTTLPVEQPFINPAPGENPAHRPQFIPTGNPVRNPNYDPNAAPGPNNSPWLQPGVRMVPSPTPAEPFRVDYQPVNRPVDSPDANPEPTPDGDDNPNDKPNPDEQPSLCEKHPDIVACQKLGDLTPETLKIKTVTLDLKREDGFGPANGSCPAPKEFAVLGKTMAFRWDLLCDFASAIRPLLIGFAYLSAALAFMGLSRKD